MCVCVLFRPWPSSSKIDDSCRDVNTKKKTEPFVTSYRIQFNLFILFLQNSMDTVHHSINKSYLMRGIHLLNIFVSRLETKPIISFPSGNIRVLFFFFPPVFYIA